MTGESLYAEMRRTRKGRLDGRAKPYRFRTRLLDNSRKRRPPKDPQTKMTNYLET